MKPAAPRPYRPISPEERNRILDLWASGTVSKTELARLVGRSVGTVATVAFNARRAGDPRALLRAPRALRVLARGKQA